MSFQTHGRRSCRRIKRRVLGASEIQVSSVTHDSRQAGAGFFFGVQGLTMDGHRFIADVMRRGAVGIISEFEAPEGFQGAWLKVENARAALAKAAAVINGNPSHDLKLVGITGTNGKTTTTYLCFALAEAAGEKAAMLTTVEYKIGERSEPAVRTTPEASDTNEFLREAVERRLHDGCDGNFLAGDRSAPLRLAEVSSRYFYKPDARPSRLSS